jgi:hypothetical protein
MGLDVVPVEKKRGKKTWLVQIYERRCFANTNK